MTALEHLAQISLDNKQGVVALRCLIRLILTTWPNITDDDKRFLFIFVQSNLYFIINLDVKFWIIAFISIFAEKQC